MTTSRCIFNIAVIFTFAVLLTIYISRGNLCLLLCLSFLCILDLPYALTLGMTAASSVNDFHPTAADSKQPFETQNQLFSSILGDPSVKIFKTQTLTPVLNNLSIKEGALYPYKVIDPGKEASFDYTFTASSDDPVYCYIDAPSRCPLKMYVNDKRTDAIKLADALLGASLPSGTCKIELKYVPHSFYLGLVISVSALAFSVLWYVLFMKKKRIRSVRS